jgi:hypothetical protein
MTCECGCGRAAAPGGLLSWACYKSKKRNGTVVRKAPSRGARYGSARATVFEAARSLAEADAGDEGVWDRAIARFLMAVIRYRRRRPNTVQKPTDTVNRG